MVGRRSQDGLFHFEVFVVSRPGLGLYNGPSPRGRALGLVHEARRFRWKYTRPRIQIAAAKDEALQPLSNMGRACACNRHGYDWIDKALLVAASSARIESTATRSDRQ